MNQVLKIINHNPGSVDVVIWGKEHRLEEKQELVISRMKKLSFIILFIIWAGGLFATRVDRVEPLFWWTGMKNPSLQLMVHGEDIGAAAVSLSYPGVRLESVSRVENPNYLFINLNIGAGTRPGRFDLHFRTTKKQLITYSYELKERGKNAAAVEGFNGSDVIYLITPDRFANGDPLNDTVEGMKEQPDRSDKDGRHGGDLKGITGHLDYLKAMGFTAVWLNPVLENNMTRTSYHGYSTTDFYKVDPRFGTNEEYRQLSDELKKRGMKLIMDMIFNHCGSEHWWMDDMPMPDWTARVLDEYPDFNIVGEEWSLNPSVVSYWQKGKVNADGYRCYLPSLMDFPLQHAVSQALASEENWDNGLIRIYETLANDFVYANAAGLVIFPDNHDMQRFYTQVNEDPSLSKMAVAFFLTTRGIPQLFYGTEILMSSPGEKQDGIIRGDFPGGWAGDAVNAFTGNGLTDKQKDMQNYLKTILNWRKEKEVVHSGKLLHFAPQDGIYVYFRYSEKEAVMVVLNKNGEERTLSTDRFQEITAPYKSGKDVVSQAQIDDLNRIRVPARSAMIIELK
ncbi:MAG: alpha-amylase family glycosyl hydrolase [Mangrovibacterium sp.]